MFFVRRFTLFVIGLVFVSVATVSAADCPAIVKSALDAAGTACASVGRNQACYGNIKLSAEPQDPSTTFSFTKPGDLVEIGGVKQLSLSPLDAQADTWGVALMKVQADLPDTLPGQNVSFVLFGDVQINNAVGSAATLNVTSKQTVNVRQQPDKAGQVVGPLQAGSQWIADGMTDDGAWLRVHSADASTQGWVSTAIVTVDGDVKTLAVVKADAPRYSPMQAFYFKSGLNDSPCAQAPDSGILIQTPQGAGKIALNVDGADITLGSTAYFQAQASGELTMSVVEGQGTMTADGKTVIVPAGTRARVPLDANLVASGAPVGPEPYDAAKLSMLPFALIPQPVTVAPALDASAIAKIGITPTPGKWLFAVNTAAAGKGCPPGFAQFVSAAMFPKNVLTFPPGPFDLKQVIDSSGSKMPASAVITHPQPNQYDIDFNEQGTKVHFELNILSPVQIEGTMNATSQGCELNLGVSMNLASS